ncbi:zf-DHHC-domain-containing protein [Calocera cornea HHB12733]|uniref:Palmitoyltransferase n=1 Tax=Calocera cornea HHB12733 TaxID=1353952 RepID=A0A165GJU6_9BASI|nr:zf-DHHC-domain-containing protein [Calocera cornea HHB12733]
MQHNTKIAVFLVPTLFFYIIFTTISLLPWYTGLCLAAAEFFGMHHVVTKVLLDAPPSSTAVTGSPYFAGIIFGSLFFVGWEWVTVLVRSTPGYAVTNLCFGFCFLLCCYNFFRSVTLDPGACPKPADEAELKSIIEELASEGRLNGQTFCVVCMARKPLRSKHCRVCDRCTARFDHHCPWVWNCVGVSNHRQFIMFILSLVLGVICFNYLVYAYFSHNVPSDAVPAASCILPTTLCSWTSQKPFLTAVSIWASLQLLWTSILLLAQLWQVTKQVTTLEVSNLSRFGFMGGRGTSALGQEGLTHPKQGQHMMGDDEPNPDGIGGHPSASAPGQRQHSKSSTAFILQLLGLDRLTAKSNRRALAHSSPNSNPFDQGVWRNCLDFWTTGRELGVEYGSLYDVPSDGFAKKPGEENGRWKGKGRKGGYEPVQAEEV